MQRYSGKDVPLPSKETTDKITTKNPTVASRLLLIMVEVAGVEPASQYAKHRHLQI